MTKSTFEMLKSLKSPPTVKVSGLKTTQYFNYLTVACMKYLYPRGEVNMPSIEELLIKISV